MTLRQASLLAGLAALGAAILLSALSPAPATAKRRLGIDVSRFQERITWNRVGKTRVKFAFVQASRGRGPDCLVVPDRCGVDEYWERNYRRARANGIRVGPYHRGFLPQEGGRKRAKRDARREAKLFVRTVGELRRRDLRPVLDFESPFGELRERPVRAWVRTWLRRVEKGLGAKPIIYTNHSSWQATGDVTAFARRGHPLWIADWQTDTPLVPADDWAGQGWSVWQFTSSGHVRGIEGRVDKNRMRVPLRELSASGRGRAR